MEAGSDKKRRLRQDSGNGETDDNGGRKCSHSRASWSKWHRHTFNYRSKKGQQQTNNRLWQIKIWDPKRRTLPSIDIAKKSEKSPNNTWEWSSSGSTWQNQPETKFYLLHVMKTHRLFFKPPPPPSTSYDGLFKAQRVRSYRCAAFSIELHTHTSTQISTIQPIRFTNSIRQRLLSGPRSRRFFIHIYKKKLNRPTHLHVDHS